MSFKSQTGICFRHTATIINDLDRGASSISHHDTNVTCSSIDSILHQFLNHRRRSLNDFTSGYLVGNGIGKKLNNV